MPSRSSAAARISLAHLRSSRAQTKGYLFEHRASNRDRLRSARTRVLGARRRALPRAVTRYWAEMHPEPFARGSGTSCATTGSCWSDSRTSTSTGSATRPSRLPTRRFGPLPAGGRSLRGKLWRDQLREWDETFKPASIATHKELQSVDPDALSDEELVAYLTRCRNHHVEMIYQHMRHTGAAIVPMGDFLAHVGDWTACRRPSSSASCGGRRPFPRGVR